MLSIVKATPAPGLVQAILPPRIQPAPGGTVRRGRVGKAPGLEAEQERQIGVQNGAFRVLGRLIHEAFLGPQHEVHPS